MIREELMNELKNMGYTNRKESNINKSISTPAEFKFSDEVEMTIDKLRNILDETDYFVMSQSEQNNKWDIHVKLLSNQNERIRVKINPTTMLIFPTIKHPSLDEIAMILSKIEDNISTSLEKTS